MQVSYETADESHIHNEIQGEERIHWKSQAVTESEPREKRGRENSDREDGIWGCQNWCFDSRIICVPEKEIRATWSETIIKSITNMENEKTK